jgi:hypothetical protein
MTERCHQTQISIEVVICDYPQAPTLLIMEFLFSWWIACRSARNDPMSIMFFKVRSLSRSKGHSAVAKAAYISRHQIQDSRTGKTHDYRKVTGLQHAEIILPDSMRGADADWARDRRTLWNEAERVETRRNARVGREYTLALPHELSDAQRLTLTRDYAHLLSNRYGTAVDIAIHGPTRRGDPRNHHAHLLTSTREITPDGFTAKTNVEINNTNRHLRGLPYIVAEYRDLRAHWATLANEQLLEAGIDQRLEARSRTTLARRGLLALQTDQLTVYRPTHDAVVPSFIARAEQITDALEAVNRWRLYRQSQVRSRSLPMALDKIPERQLDDGLSL